MGVAVGMAQRVLCALLLAAALVCGGAEAAFNRHSFPKGFIFGTGSASYQYEGVYKEGGKGVSIWDTFTRIPSKIKSNDTGDVAVDFYHRYKEDVQLLKDMNMDAFRFSIAWTRILPNGSLSDGVNKEGVAFYNNLINEIISKGMEPYVTIFRWDTPQALESKYGGFLSENIIKDYADFAEVCFREFGDRVKFWNTFNEPWTYAVNGYAAGSFAPGRCSPHVSASCLGAGSVHRDAQHHPGPRGGRAAVPRQVPADAARADRHHGGLRLVRAQQRHRRRPGRRAAQPRLHAGLVPGTRRARRVPGHHAGIPRRPAAAVHRRAGGGSQGVLRLPRSQLLHRVLREERAAAQRARAVVQRRHPRQHVGVPRRRAHRRRAHRRPAVRAHLLHVPGRDPRAPALHQPAVQPAEHLHPGERHRRGEQPEHPDQGGAQGQAPHLVPLQALAVREARHPERRQSEGLLHVDVHGLLRVGRRVPGPLRPHLHRPPRRPQALPQAVQLLDREVPQETLVACAPDTLATGQEAGARAAVQVASDFNKLQSNLFSVVFVLSCL